jgi:hypothetical protein
MPRKITDTYIHPEKAEAAIRKAYAKLGSYNKIAKIINCSSAHIYRLRDSTCWMREIWYKRIKSI